MKKKLIAASLVGLTLIGAAFASTTTQGTVEQNAMVTRGHNASITKYTTWSDFMPNAPITREQAAKMIAMWIAGNPSIQIEAADKECTFKDQAQIDSSLSDWVRTSCQYGLFNGYKGNFMPTKYITTEDIMAVADRLSMKSPVIKQYAAISKINVGANRLLLRGELLNGLHTLDVYVKAQADIESANQLQAAQDKVNKAKMVWASKNLITYNLTQTVSCFCGPQYTRPVKYSVISNSIYTEGAVYADASGGAMTGTAVPTLHTIDDAFGLIQNAIDNKAASVTVTYDDVLGYPTTISIDRSKMIADEEQYYTFKLNQ